MEARIWSISFQAQHYLSWEPTCNACCWKARSARPTKSCLVPPVCKWTHFCVGADWLTQGLSKNNCTQGARRLLCHQVHDPEGSSCLKRIRHCHASGCSANKANRYFRRPPVAPMVTSEGFPNIDLGPAESDQRWFTASNLTRACSFGFCSPSPLSTVKQPSFHIQLKYPPIFKT